LGGWAALTAAVGPSRSVILTENGIRLPGWWLSLGVLLQWRHGARRHDPRSATHGGRRNGTFFPRTSLGNKGPTQSRQTPAVSSLIGAILSVAETRLTWCVPGFQWQPAT